MARTDVRVTAFIIRDGKVLIIHRFKKGDEYWTLPGGGVEEGESLLEALTREVKEETGLDVIGHQLVDHSNPNRPFFWVKTNSGEPVLGGQEVKAHSEDNQFILTWVDRNELKNIGFVFPKEGLDIIDKIPYEN